MALWALPTTYTLGMLDQGLDEETEAMIEYMTRDAGGEATDVVAAGDEHEWDPNDWTP